MSAKVSFLTDYVGTLTTPVRTSQIIVHIYFALFPCNHHGLDAMFGDGMMDEDNVRRNSDWT